jgi:alkylhydroperoxidase/carboxymuconolactone decarboxylase family protein YurZ
MALLHMPDTLHSAERRQCMKASTALLIAALWGVEPVLAQEQRMTDSKKGAALSVSLADVLPPAKDKLLPLNEEAEKQRATQVSTDFGVVSPGLVQNTTDLLFRDLWLRPALAPRDRSLVTVSALTFSISMRQQRDRQGRTVGKPTEERWTHH